MLLFRCLSRASLEYLSVEVDADVEENDRTLQGSSGQWRQMMFLRTEIPDRVARHAIWLWMVEVEVDVKSPRISSRQTLLAGKAVPAVTITKVQVAGIKFQIK